MESSNRAEEEKEVAEEGFLKGDPLPCLSHVGHPFKHAGEAGEKLHIPLASQPKRGGRERVGSVVALEQKRVFLSLLHSAHLIPRTSSSSSEEGIGKKEKEEWKVSRPQI